MFKREVNEKQPQVADLVKNWRTVSALARKVGKNAVVAMERTEKRMNLEMAHRHPDTDAILSEAVDALRASPSAWDAESNASLGLNNMCRQIHETFTEKLCNAEYAEVGVMLRDEKKNAPFVRFHALHGSTVMPSATKVHHGERIVYDPPPDFIMTRANLYKGLYGAMMHSLDTVVSNDCDTDDRHIKMPAGHTHMRNLLGLPLWADTGAEPGNWHPYDKDPTLGEMQDFPPGKGDAELCGLYFVANTSTPNGYSEEFVRSLSALQWGLGLLMYIVREMEALEKVAYAKEVEEWKAWESEERIDPEDGKSLTWEMLTAKYKGTYTEDELSDYWERDMKPKKKPSKKSKL